LNLLLDECIDRRFGRLLTWHDVSTVPGMGWAGVQNGELMRLAEQRFDAFITVDRNLSYQQDLSNFSIAVIVLRARSNRLVDLQPFAAKVLAELPNLRTGEVTVITL
jgi:hypothetical protein